MLTHSFRSLDVNNVMTSYYLTLLFRNLLRKLLEAVISLRKVWKRHCFSDKIYQYGFSVQTSLKAQSSCSHAQMFVFRITIPSPDISSKLRTFVPPQPPVTTIIIFLICQEFISVRADSETEWPITKSAQLQKKGHKQTEVRQVKFMCN